MPNTLCRDVIDTPIGALTLIGSDRGVRAVLWPDDAAGRVKFAEEVMDGAHPVLDLAGRELLEYFGGERQEFTVALDPMGTEFQVRVWRSLASIPYGTTVSYGEQARRVGSPRAVRAVGAANGRNPLSILLPCHRVLAGNGALTGFAGGLSVKRYLLDLEAARATPALFDAQ